MRDQKAFHTSSSSYYRFLNSHLISNLFVLHQFLKRLMLESEAWVFGMCILWMHSCFLKNKLQQYLQFMWKYLWEIDTFDFSPNALLKFSVWSITWFFQTEVYLENVMIVILQWDNFFFFTLEPDLRHWTSSGLQFGKSPEKPIITAPTLCLFYPLSSSL